MSGMRKTLVGLFVSGALVLLLAAVWGTPAEINPDANGQQWNIYAAQTSWACELVYTDPPSSLVWDGPFTGDYAYNWQLPATAGTWVGFWVYDTVAAEYTMSYHIVWTTP